MNKKNELKEKINTIKKMGWIECPTKNYGCAGLKLEELLEINPENFEIPDYNGIEIKTKKSILNERISLFCAAPDSYLFENKRLYTLYSYPSKNDKQYKVLNINVNSKYKKLVSNQIYFQLKVNKEKEKIQLLIYNNYKLIDTYTSWSFDLLKEKLERKLMYLCFVNVKSYYSNNKLYVKYTNDEYYKLRDFKKFINLIDNGIISISFRIDTFKNGNKKGKIHDHGTCFCIDKNNLELLFQKCE